jgi:aminoglycoside 3-N-acetyltransferase I
MIQALYRHRCTFGTADESHGYRSPTTCLVITNYRQSRSSPPNQALKPTPGIAAVLQSACGGRGLVLSLCSLKVSVIYSAGVSIQELMRDDTALMKGLLSIFGEAFDEVETYVGNQPSAGYLRKLLGSDSFIALVALKSGEVVAGIAVYQLKKFEQERSEIYIYDLAVAVAHRREGIATALIQELKKLAVARGAYVIFVQADMGMTRRSRCTRSLGLGRTYCTLI